ncbi:hypothetical protein [Dactylosporangium sp. CA-092794]|uniref:hypothetical protein n=1 Tax=Dactylosporangium sp. CA-092794 TaxID=3239929 RepID=UPI003D8FD88B
MHRVSRLVPVGVAAVLVLAGCGGPGPAADTGGAGDVPGGQAYVEYRPPGNRYTIQVPQGWARTESAGTATFTDKLNTITVALGSRPAAPDVVSGTSDLDALRGTTPGFTPGTVSTVERPAGEALLVTYRADAPADPVTGTVVNDDVERYQFWRDTNLLTVTLAGPHGSDDVDAWRIVTESVRWLP